MQVDATSDAVVITLDYDESTTLNAILDVASLDKDFRPEEIEYAQQLVGLLQPARRRFWGLKSWRKQSA
jgi:hypothetical protein